MQDLARALVETRFATLPRNVRAAEYVEVTVAVLGQEHGVQARPFAGSDARDTELHARFQHAAAKIAALLGQ